MQEESATIHYRLWKYRKEMGLTQAEVAEILGLKTAGQIYRWEKGKRMPSLRQAMQLSCLYKRLINDLFWEMYTEECDRMHPKKRKILDAKARQR